MIVFNVYLLCIIIFIGAFYTSAQEGGSCFNTALSIEGKCISLQYCPSSLEILSSGGKPQNCGFKDRTSLVCCTDKVNAVPDRKSVQMCNQYQSEIETLLLKSDCVREKGSPLIPGGFPVDKGEYPHMVAIGYKSEDSSKTKYLCNGILISRNVVLTVAHCLHTRLDGSPTTVRVGDLDLNSDKDGAQSQEVRVSRMFVHPDYNPGLWYNDIGLLQLEENVKFSQYAYPACLAVTEEIEVDAKVMETGWTTRWTTQEPNYGLMKIWKKVISNENCTAFYNQKKRRLPNGIDSKTHVCYKNIDDSKGSCYGGSGGTLQKEVIGSCKHTVLGLAAYGPGCVPSASPEVFIKIFPYLNWIEKIAWP